MVTRVRIAVLAALAMFAVQAPAYAQDAHEMPALGLAGDGVTLTDTESGQVDTVGFGTSQDDTVQFVSTALGDPVDSGMSEECGAGPLANVDFQGGLRLLFQAGNFVGWSVSDDSGFETPEGIKLGMLYPALTRAVSEVEAEETSIGFEFTAGNYGGVLSEGGPNGVITALWTGMTCIAR